MFVEIVNHFWLSKCLVVIFFSELMIVTVTLSSRSMTV